jgi:Icc-related predicted phosphoesterase
MRIAAVADLHFGPESAGTLRPHLDDIPERADVLLLGGDLTRVGEPSEAEVLADELRDVAVPVVAVLGNHDFHVGRPGAVADILERAGIRVLEGDTFTLDVNGKRLSVAGVKGFGGGFLGACGSEFGEPEMKEFVRHTHERAERLGEALASKEADIRVALMHYAPIPETLHGERLEIFPFLGSYLLAEAVDAAGADLAIHGHAHAGSERGQTPGGIPVRNVALPVIGRPYKVYCFGVDEGCDDDSLSARERVSSTMSSAG